MERMEQIFTLTKPLAEERFKQIQAEIEAYCAKHGKEIADETVSAFRNAFLQAAKLQMSGEKGAVRYLVLSHLFSSVYADGYAVKIDCFDQRFYSDSAELEAYLKLDWLNPFLEKDMESFRKELAEHLPRLMGYELDRVRYRYVWYYHSIIRRFLTDIIGSLLELPEFGALASEPEFEVLFGGYMDKAVVIWAADNKEKEHEILLAGN